jgi:iron complex transport system substrate-binding protein
MGLTRRALLAAPALLFGTAGAQAATVNDATGRAMDIPATVNRVFPARPPAAIMLYTLAPELLLGWPRANRTEECAFLLPDICARPEVGRLTGRGNTANLESVLALKPNFILDIGSTTPTFASLAVRVQEQTNIPYALLDGRFEAIPYWHGILRLLSLSTAISPPMSAAIRNGLASPRSAMVECTCRPSCRSAGWTFRPRSTG